MRCARVLLALLLAGAGSAPTGASLHRPDEDEPRLMITAVHAIGREGALDEAFRVANVSAQPLTLGEGWSARDQVGRAISLARLTLGPHQSAWVANNADAFARQFGMPPALAYGGPGAAFTLANDGGSVRLTRAATATFDTANAGSGGWDAGVGSPAFRSMERIDSGGPDVPGNWASGSAGAPAALDRMGNAIAGTPRMTNSVAVANPSQGHGVVINEVAWMGTRASPDDEWIELHNTLDARVAITGWRITVDGKQPIPLTGTIAPGGFFVVQRQIGTFADSRLADQTLRWQPNLSNAGEVLRLSDAREVVVDAVAYGNAGAVEGWRGPPLQPYAVPGAISAEGQVLVRRTGLPDTDTAQDWMNDRDDAVDGRRPIYPGWDLTRDGRLAQPIVAASTLTLAVAPDASYDMATAALGAAARTIDIEVYTFEHAALGELLARKSAEGVRVRMLLDGGPVGGITDQERWVCLRLSQAGNGDGGCWFMRADANAKVARRYKALHPKFAVVDGAALLAASENFGPGGYPDDDKSDGTLGHRGVVALLTSPALVDRAQAVFDEDFDAANRDIRRWCAACAPLGAPPYGFTPVYTTGGVSSTVRFAQPLVVSAPVTVELATSPESNLRREGGLLALLARAGPGDEVLVQQLSEPAHWGSAEATGESDPNLRLQAVIEAARRGARARVMLDGYYADADDVRGNYATAGMLNDLARREGLDLRALVADPTGQGIHNKMFLVRLGERAFAQIGSWNGTEVSAKVDREMTLLIESVDVHAYLRGVFFADWWSNQPVYLPVIARDSVPQPERPRALISEVMANPAGADETGREWVEIYNPGGLALDLSGIKIGDAETAGKFGEGMYRFPPGAVLPAQGVIVVAEDGAAFIAEWGRRPDYEIADYEPSVPDLILHTEWATGTLSLNNGGDQVLLLDASDAVMDAAQWLTDTLRSTRPFNVAVPGGHSLQRYPPAQDSDDCALDFRDQAIPSPGRVP